MFVSSWIGSAFGRRRNAKMIREEGSQVVAVYVGHMGDHRVPVTAEFWTDGRFRLIDDRGTTMIAGTVAPADGPGSVFVQADATIFADVDRAAKAERTEAPVIRREREEY